MSIISMQLEIFIIVICGYILAKLSIIDRETRKKLTDIVINLVLPCSIIKSFSMEITMDLIKSTITIFIVSFIIQISYSIFNKIFYNRIEENKALILKYATIVSNAGFMGLPIVESIYGSEGLLYASIALVPLRVFMWSSGLSLFTTANKKDVVKKVLLHPCIIAVYIGFVFMLLISLQIPIPEFITNTISAIGGCTTCLSMLVIGSILTDIKFSELYDISGLYYSFIRLILIPLLIYAVLSVLNLDKMVIGVSVLLSAMPAGSTSAMLAQKYDKDVIYASKIIVISTMLSLVTLPLISFIIK